MDWLWTWTEAHPGIVTALVVGSLLMLVGSAITVPFVVARIPADFFLTKRTAWAEAHPALRLSFHVVKNLLGGVLLAAGLAMLVLPGQGLLTILAAVALLDFPGKRRLELWIVSRRRIRSGIAWLRERAGKPPLRYPDEDGEQQP